MLETVDPLAALGVRSSSRARGRRGARGHACCSPRRAGRGRARSPGVPRGGTRSARRRSRARAARALAARLGVAGTRAAARRDGGCPGMRSSPGSWPAGKRKGRDRREPRHERGLGSSRATRRCACSRATAGPSRCRSRSAALVQRALDEQARSRVRPIPGSVAGGRTRPHRARRLAAQPHERRARRAAASCGTCSHAPAGARRPSRSVRGARLALPGRDDAPHTPQSPAAHPRHRRRWIEREVRTPRRPRPDGEREAQRGLPPSGSPRRSCWR